MWGSDYPHTESTFPRSRQIVSEIFAGLPTEDLERVVCEERRVAVPLRGPCARCERRARHPRRPRRRRHRLPGRTGPTSASPAGGSSTSRLRVHAPDEIDAAGRIVVPGFIDIHTHYDPQVLWDPMLSPSCWHGVTSVVAGNCGYSIVPTRPAERGTLLRTLDKVEDMRLATLEAGIDWAFETYPAYLDADRGAGAARSTSAATSATPRCAST